MKKKRKRGRSARWARLGVAEIIVICVAIGAGVVAFGLLIYYLNQYLTR